MNNLFDDFTGGQLSAYGGPDRFAPQIDVRETEKAFRITAELPGLEEKDVEVTLVDDVLTLKGEKKQEHSDEKEGCYHSERSYGFFERAVQLPRDVDADNVKAKFRKGVLDITVPKKPDAHSKRKKIELESD